MKMKVGILFGGQSQEHEISLLSAMSILANLDREKYEAIPIGIDKSGQWHFIDLGHFLTYFDQSPLLESKHVENLPKKSQVNPTANGLKSELDVIFPILHGPLGEDGTVQGLLKLLGIPFVGCDHLSSAIAMDKDVTKRLLNSWNIRTAKFLTLYAKDDLPFDEVKKTLGLPLFIKPVHLGSSVGIRRAKNEKEYYEALEEAFLYDTKVIVEEEIQGREIECSVLGNRNPKASLPAELILPEGEFYSYKLKYLDSSRVQFDVPAKLPQEMIELVQNRAIDTYLALGCEGMARIDFFLTKGNELLVNEVNPIPGFTKISLYPQMWDKSGLSYRDLLDELIRLAIERGERDNKVLKTIDPHYLLNR